MAYWMAAHVCIRNKIIKDDKVLKSHEPAHNSLYTCNNNYCKTFQSSQQNHGVQRRMILVDNFFVFLRLLFFAVLLLYVT